MTVKDLLDVLASAVQIDIINNKTDENVLSIKNATGASTSYLSQELADSTVNRFEIKSANSIYLVVDIV